MRKIPKIKKKIQTGAAINCNKQQQQRANDATSEVYPPKVGNLTCKTSIALQAPKRGTQLRPRSKLAWAQQVTQPRRPVTVANACHTRVIRLAANKCWTMQAKSKAYQRQIQKQTDNQIQTGHDSNLKSMRYASMLSFGTKENQGLAAIKKKKFRPGPGIIISDYATSSLIT